MVLSFQGSVWLFVGYSSQAPLNVFPQQKDSAELWAGVLLFVVAKGNGTNQATSLGPYPKNKKCFGGYLDCQIAHEDRSLYCPKTVIGVFPFLRVV